MRAPVSIYCIGLGRQFTGHLLPELLDRSDIGIRSIYDCSKERVSAVSCLMNEKGINANTPIDYPEFLRSLQAEPNKNRTVAMVSTPGDSHYEIAKALLEIGVHVYIDKPFVTQLLHAQTLLKIAEQNNCQIVVGCQRRFEDVFRAMVDQLDSIGEITRIYLHSHGNFRQLDLENLDMNILPHGIGYHIVDQAVWLATQAFGEDCKLRHEGSILRRRRDKSEFIASFDTLLCCQNIDSVVPISISASTLSPRDSVDELVGIMGVNGELRLTRRKAPRNAEPGVLEYLYWSEESERVNCITINPKGNTADRAAPFRQFVNAIDSDSRECLQSTGRDAIVTVGLIEDILNSSNL